MKKQLVNRLWLFPLPDDRFTLLAQALKCFLVRRLRQIITDSFPISVVRVKAQRLNHIRLTDEEVMPVGKQESTVLCQAGARFRIVRVPAIQKNIEVGFVPKL